MGESDKEADSTASDIQEPVRLMVTFNVREIMSRIQARCNSSSEAEQPPQIFGRESEIEVRTPSFHTRCNTIDTGSSQRK